MLLRAICAGLLLLGGGAAWADGHLTVRDAWVRAIPPGATITAGYATLGNDGDAPVTILTAQSDAFRSVTLHETLVSDGVARMREIHRLVVAPGATVKLEPGGRHLMLMSPRHAPAVGEKIGITLLLRDGRRIDTYFDVVAPATGDAD